MVISKIMMKTTNSANYKNLEPSEKLEMEFNAFGLFIEHPNYIKPF